MHLEIITESPRATHELGETFGVSSKAGCTIALIGDLGAGKTLFVRGLARGLAVDPGIPITSPTFTLINRYRGESLDLFHVDLYRIYDPEELDDIGLDEILAGRSGVTAVEWADRLPPDCLADHVRLEIAFEDDATRRMRIFACGLNSAALLKAVANEVRQKLRQDARGKTHPHVYRIE